MSNVHRYENVDSSVTDLVSDVLQTYFNDLAGAKIKVIFDTRKRTHGGNIVLGRMQKCNELIKYLTDDDEQSPEGYDFFLYLDKNIYEALDDAQRRQVIFHELCHCGVDFDRDDPYYIVPHDVETFYVEIEYNVGDPRWYEALSTVANAVYARTD